MIDGSEEAAFDLQLRREGLWRGAEKASKHRRTCDSGLLTNVLTEAAAPALWGRVVRQCTAVHLITSPLRKEVNEAVC